MGQGIKELLKDYIENTVKLFVDNPKEISVNVDISTKNVIVQVKTNKSDVGKVIGKKGRNIDALKVIALAIKNTQFPEDNRRVSLEILEDEGSGFNRKNKTGG